MKLDEFSFFNQQLAAMLREGLPIEGALCQLVTGMERGSLKDELTRLQTELAAGAPLAEAVTRRALPDLYKRMVLVGVKSNNLPGVLALLADYYQQRNNTATRLKGLMVYPVLVLGLALLVSGGIAAAWAFFLMPAFKDFLGGINEGRALPAFTQMMMQPINTMAVPPLIIGVFLLIVLLVAFVPAWRSAMRWRLPAFKESNLAQSAAALHLMLRSGVPLPDALALLAQVEAGNRAGNDLNTWRTRLAAGVASFADVAQGSRAFPPLFVWMVANAGEELAAGFEKAATIYRARAAHRTEMLLYAALPACVLVLGLMILTQAWFAIGAFLPLIDLMNNLGGSE
jgi:type II secretory pathway component PulF